MLKSKTFRIAIVVFAASLIVGVSAPLAQASVQVTLTPANVVGGSNAYSGSAGGEPFNQGQFNATQILDNQSGTITETSQHGYWINPDNGPANAYITVNLGGLYYLSSVELYNTSNANYQDRGTGDFSILGGTAVSYVPGHGLVITGPTTTLASGTLTAATNAEAVSGIPGQSFATLGNPVQFLEFLPTSVASGGTPCCGANNYGLNELKVFGTAVPAPEPASLAIWGLVIAGGLAVARRRRA